MLGNVKMHKGHALSGYELTLFKKTDRLVHLANILKDELQTIENAPVTKAEMILLSEMFLKDEIAQLEHGSSYELEEELVNMLDELHFFVIDVEVERNTVEKDPVLAKMLEREIKYTEEILKNDFIFMLKDRIETTIKEMLKML